MTATRDYTLYLADILQAIGNIENYTEGYDSQRFLQDSKTQDAVVRNLEVIGEGVKKIPQSVRDAHQTIEWKPAAAMRDFLIHDYPEVDAEVVWETIQRDLPALKQGVEICLAAVEKPD